MSTTKPRITVTLEPRTYEVLSRLSVAGGESMSSLIAQLVDLAVPSMERLVVVLERARAAPQEARAGLASAIERAERELLPALVAAQDQTDLFLAEAAAAVGPASAGAAQRHRRAPAASPKRATPALVTRGSGGQGKGRRGGKRG